LRDSVPGDPRLDELFSGAYEELRRLASLVKSDDPRATLSPTTLVNEAFLKLAAAPRFKVFSKLQRISRNDAFRLAAALSRSYTGRSSSQTNASREVPMPRRRRMVQGVESSQDLERKLQILERELEVQRAAMEKLKLLGPAEKATQARAGLTRRKSA